MIICQLCGEMNSDGAEKCSRCGKELPLKQPPTIAENLPQAPSGKTPRISSLAIWSLVFAGLAYIPFYYPLYGLVEFIPLFAILGVIFGGMALLRIGKSHGQLAGSTLAFIGLVPSIISIVLCIYFIADILRDSGSNRPQISRAKNDMRSISTALESYYIDNNKYPSAFDATGGWSLTTPVAYMTQTPPDPFAPVKGASFHYDVDPTGATWIIWSAGPDRKYDLTSSNLGSILKPNNPTMAADPKLQSLTFDPTNGTRSSGDIWRLKQ